MRKETLGHDLRRAKDVPPHEHKHMARVLRPESAPVRSANILESCEAHLGQVHALLARRVTTSDNGQRLVAEDGDRAIADGAGRDTALPVRVLSGEIETAGGGASGDDDRIGRLGRLVLGALAPVLERSLGQVCAGVRSVSRRGAERQPDTPILEMVSVWMTVPNRMLCARKRSIISGPRMPSGKPGLQRDESAAVASESGGQELDTHKFSTSVVVVSCPPAAKPFASMPCGGKERGPAVSTR